MLNLGSALQKKPFDYTIEHPSDSDVKFHCKANGMKEDLKLLKKYKGKSYVEKGVHIQEEPDSYEIAKAKFIATVVSWEGITDLDGETPLACTDEVKEKIFEKYADSLCSYILEQVKKKIAEEVGIDRGN